MDHLFFLSKFNQDISDWKFHPSIFIDADLGRVLDNSYNIKRQKEKLLLSSIIESVTQQPTSSL